MMFLFCVCFCLVHHANTRGNSDKGVQCMCVYVCVCAQHIFVDSVVDQGKSPCKPFGGMPSIARTNCSSSHNMHLKQELIA